MTFRFAALATLLGAALCLPFATGCNKPATDAGAPVDEGDEVVDPHDKPLTEEQLDQLKQETAKYPDAVAKVEELVGTVKSETVDGLPENPFDAHQALDKADRLLEWLPQIAQDSGVPREQWGTVNENAQALREALDKVHLNIDARKAPDYEAVASDIDSALSALKGVPAGE